MKRLTALALLLLLINLSFATPNLVQIPAPAHHSALTQDGFQLLCRAGNSWIGLLPLAAKLPAGGIILTDYDLSAGDYFQLSFPSAEEAAKLTGKVNILHTSGSELIIQATDIQLQSLPPLKAQWRRIPLVPQPMNWSGVPLDETDQFHPLVYEFVSLVDSAAYRGYIQSLQDFVTRNTRTNTIQLAAQWLQQQFSAFGLTTTLDPFLISGMTRYNVVGDLIGETYPDEIVLITGHYDATAGQPSAAEPIAPGADDNASGVAAVLESARILSQYSFGRTLRFVAFAGEEQGLYGSEDYVTNLVTAGTNVVGCFNFDMIAWSGSDPWPPDLMIYSDNNPLSQAMGAKLVEAVQTFVPTEVEPQFVVDPSVVYSDHGPFWDAGYPAILGIEEEAWGPDFNPYYHSVNDLIVYCDIAYASACTKAGIAALADYAIPIVTAGPALMVSDYTLTEIVGNGNGQPDPGETFSAALTLTNVGVEPALDVSAYLLSYDPNLAMNQAFSTYPDLLPESSAVSLTPYNFTISPACPPNYPAILQVDIYLDTLSCFYSSISFVVSDPLYQPYGPDTYGYYAFDIMDENGPVYDWMEIAPAQGGQGSQLNFTGDDQTLLLTLPFIFDYYGQSYSQISLCSNGWIALGINTTTDYTNSVIPDPDGPPAMLAPFWEDLSPQFGGSISFYYHTAEHRFIIEFDSIRQYSPDYARETFQVMLYDPAFHFTPTGDGKILFQFKNVTDIASCTIGIEDPTETVGLECWYNGGYPEQMLPIGDETAILFTTIAGHPDVTVTLTPAVTPIQIPVSGGTFEYNIAATNAENTAQTFNVWCNVTLPTGLPYGPTLGPANITLSAGQTIDRDRIQSVPALAPAGDYIYRAYVGLYPGVVWSEDNFLFTKLPFSEGPLVENWNNWGEAFEGEIGEELKIQNYQLKITSVSPNPFNQQTAISFELPEAGKINLVIYDILGREVQSLATGHSSLGKHTVVWDAGGQSSGVYFIRLSVDGRWSMAKKVVLMK